MIKRKKKVLCGYSSIFGTQIAIKSTQPTISPVTRAQARRMADEKQLVINQAPGNAPVAVSHTFTSVNTPAIFSFLTPFSGENGNSSFRAFIKQFNEVANAFGYTEDQCTRILPLLLTGTAKIKFHQLTEAEKANLKTLVTTLQGKLESNLQQEGAKCQLRIVQQGKEENVPSFAVRVQNLIDSAYPGWEAGVTAKMKADYFLAGLRAPIKTILRRKNIDQTDFEALLGAAEKEEAFQNLERQEKVTDSSKIDRIEDNVSQLTASINALLLTPTHEASPTNTHFSRFSHSDPWENSDNQFRKREHSREVGDGRGQERWRGERERNPYNNSGRYQNERGAFGPYRSPSRERNFPEAWQRQTYSWEGRYNNPPRHFQNSRGRGNRRGNFRGRSNNYFRGNNSHPSRFNRNGSSFPTNRGDHSPRRLDRNSSPRSFGQRERQEESPRRSYSPHSLRMEPRVQFLDNPPAVTVIQPKAEEARKQAEAESSAEPTRVSVPYFPLMFAVLALLSGAQAEEPLQKFQFCGLRRAGTLFEIPTPKTCNYSLETQVLHTRVEMFVKSNLPDLIPAIHCVKMVCTVCTRSYLHYNLEVICDDTERLPVSKKQCEQMRDNKQIEGKPLKLASPYLWHTAEPVQYSYPIWGTRCSTTTNFKYEEGDIAIYFNDTILSDLSDTTGCKVNSDECILPHESLFWDRISTKPHCPYVSAGLFPAYTSKTHLIIDSVHVSLSFSLKGVPALLQQVCKWENAQAMDNDIILLFPEIETTLPIPVWIHKNPVLVESVSKANADTLSTPMPQTPPSSLKSAKTYRVMLAGTKVYLDSAVDTTNVRIQYAYDSLAIQLAHHLQSAAFKFCQLHNHQLFHLKWLMQIDPTLAARLLLGREDVAAVTAGDALMIVPCISVPAEHIYWNHKVNGRCFKLLPIQAQGKLYFRAPASRDLSTTGFEINCDSLPPLAYRRKGGTWRTQAGETSVLKMPSTMPNIQTLQINFNKPSIYHSQLPSMALALNSLAHRVDNAYPFSVQTTPFQSSKLSDEIGTAGQELTLAIFQETKQIFGASTRTIQAVLDDASAAVTRFTLAIISLLLVILFIFLAQKFQWHKSFITKMRTHLPKRPKKPTTTAAIEMTEFPPKPTTSLYPPISPPEPRVQLDTTNQTATFNAKPGGHIPAPMLTFVPLVLSLALPTASQPQPLVWLTLNGTPHICLIDTGSALTYINTDFL